MVVRRLPIRWWTEHFDDGSIEVHASEPTGERASMTFKGFMDTAFVGAAKRERFMQIITTMLAGTLLHKLDQKMSLEKKPRP